MTVLNAQFSMTRSTTTSSFFFIILGMAGVGVKITLLFLNSSNAGKTWLNRRLPEAGNFPSPSSILDLFGKVFWKRGKSNSPARYKIHYIVPKFLLVVVAAFT